MGRIKQSGGTGPYGSVGKVGETKLNKVSYGPVAKFGTTNVQGQCGHGQNRDNGGRKASENGTTANGSIANGGKVRDTNANGSRSNIQGVNPHESGGKVKGREEDERAWTKVKEIRRGRKFVGPMFNIRRGCGTRPTPDLNAFEALEENEDQDQLSGMDGEIPLRQGKWIKITAVADSGTVVSVMPEHLVPFVKTVPTEESRAKKKYRGAGGEPIPVLGEKSIEVVTKEGQKKTTTWRICPVKRPLLSLSQVIAKGHRVQLDEKGPHILNVKTGQKTKLRMKGKVFELDMWVKVPDTVDTDAMDVSVFMWPEA